ncbi:MAG: Exo-poly-alpha-galacturonosidase [Massilibacillus sp.]|nr:Exo-poly-alpha-galacturonosidase [Massilibacillus sp.]
MKKQTIIMMILAVIFCFNLPSSCNAAFAETTPQNLKIPALAFDESSINLVWEKPADYTKIVNYHIYMNGNQYIGEANGNKSSAALPYIEKFYGNSSNDKAQKISIHNYKVTGLQPNTTYTFTVRAVYADGKESPDSNRVTQLTTSIPKIFNIAEYGAVGDGTTLNTKAIQATIDACSVGGKVLIPAGTFKTGAIWLKGNMTLEVAKGATLLGSENPEDYAYHFKLYEYSSDERFYALINAEANQKTGIISNIRIVGQGTIDGNGWQKNVEQTAYLYAKNVVDKDGNLDTNHVLNIGILAKAQVEKLMQMGLSFKSSYPRRSNLITLRGVNNVYYDGFTALNPSNHTLVNIKCDNVTVSNVTFKTFDCNNGDGIEFIHGNGLTVFNNFFDTGDDCVNFAAGLGAAGQKDKPTQNAWIFDNYFHHGHGAVVTGSHTAAWIQNILAEDNVIENTDVGFRAKTAPPIGGGARDIVFRDNALKNIKNQAFIFTSGYSDPNAVVEYEPARIPGQFKNIRIENCTVDTAGGAAIEVQGAQNGFHENLYFSNIMFYNTKPMKINYLKNGSFENLIFENDKSKG